MVIPERISGYFADVPAAFVVIALSARINTSRSEAFRISLAEVQAVRLHLLCKWGGRPPKSVKSHTLRSRHSSATKSRCHATSRGSLRRLGNFARSARFPDDHG